MLVLTRKANESINIGEDIEIFVVEIKDDHVKIGIKAPKEVPIYRQEIYKLIVEENNRAAATTEAALDDIAKILPKELTKKP